MRCFCFQHTSPGNLCKSQKTLDKMSWSFHPKWLRTYVCTCVALCRICSLWNSECNTPHRLGFLQIQTVMKHKSKSANACLHLLISHRQIDYLLVCSVPNKPLWTCTNLFALRLILSKIIYQAILCTH